MNVSRFSKLIRHKAVRFVAIFACSVLILLTVHAEIVDTRGNDFYLYGVAKSTAWLLNLIGDSAEVIGSPRSFPRREAYVRASLEAWQTGEDAPAPEEYQGIEASPLTPWEKWRYSAVSQRRDLDQLLKEWKEKSDQWKSDPLNGPNVQKMKTRIRLLQSRDLGPTVTFVLRRGLTSRMAEIRRGIAKAYQDTQLTEEERSARVERDRERLRELEEKRAQLAETAPEAMKDKAFAFVVVPDCGAIPTMVIFIAAVLAFPARWWKKLAGIGVGLPFLYIVNTLRLTILATIGAWDNGGAVFKFAHEYVWQGVYIIFVVVAWLAWVELLVRRKKN